MITPSHNTCRISLINTLTLVWHWFEFTKLYGHHCTSTTEDEFKDRLSKSVKLPIKLAESLLYCSNLLNEKKKFNHLDDLTFESMIDRICRENDLTFDKEYNVLEGDIK